MLIRFSIKNYSVFKDRVELTMIPAKCREMSDHIIDEPQGKAVQALPLAVIYGANASGKSTLIRALNFLQNLVINGVKVDRPVGIVPHLLDLDTAKKPSEFEIVFKKDGVVYTYGLVLSQTKVLEEWLFAYFSKNESRIFERKTTDDNKTEVQGGEKLFRDTRSAGFINFVAQGTRANELFLYEAYNKDIDIIKPVVQWFKNNLTIIFPSSKYILLAVRAFKEKSFISYISRFLHDAGTGVDKIVFDKEPLDKSEIFLSFPEQLQEQIKKDLSQRPSLSINVCRGVDRIVIVSGSSENEKPGLLRLRAAHKTTDGSVVNFDIRRESDGTRRLMDLVPVLFESLGNDHVFVIDELDRSLHTMLSRQFLETILYARREKGSQDQYIITTHDTNLLDRKLLRRDEIVFLEKNKQGSSHISYLSDYKTTESLNYENGYLNGRFGAIPFIGDIQRLMDGDK